MNIIICKWVKKLQIALKKDNRKYHILANQNIKRGIIVNKHLKNSCTVFAPAENFFTGHWTGVSVGFVWSKVQLGVNSVMVWKKWKKQV